MLAPMPRPMWRGAISFGMVAIPVRMYLATETRSVSFRLLCPSCLRPIKQKRYCPYEGKEIGWNEAIRGFEVAKDQFVPLDESDLQRLPLLSARTIEIVEFVADDEIHAGLYLDQAYYLEPEDVGLKPYYLLKKALERTGRVAIGKLAIRDREHLVRLAPHDRVVLLNTLRWPDEIRSTADLRLPEEEVAIHDRELDMAVMLVENLAATFDPSRHRDRYREALLALVEEKLGQRQLTAPEPVPTPQVIDLMAALKASIEAAQARKAGATATGDASLVGGAAETARASRAAAGGGRRRKAS